MWGRAGAVVVPNAQALGYTQADFARPSPVADPDRTAGGHTETLRYTYKKDWGPRIGFAFRPWNNDKLVVRGGWGRFIQQPWASRWSPAGRSAPALSTTPIRLRMATATPPSLSRRPFQFQLHSRRRVVPVRFPIHYIDPSVQQWNLTVEQDLGHDIGLRMSYIGSHGSQLETFVDVNQVPANTIGWNASFPYLYRAVSKLGVYRERR